MADSNRSSSTSLPVPGHLRKENVLQSGTLEELPTITQAQVFGVPSPIGSDQFDFATKTSSPRTPRANNESPSASDYLNGGQPHDRVSPQPDQGPPAWLPLQEVNATTTHSSVPSTLPTAGTAPTGERSVQFANNDVVLEPPPVIHHERQGSWDTKDTMNRIRGSSFMTKLKELAGPSTSQTFKSPNYPPEINSTASSPTVSRHRVPRSVDDRSDEDADAEETADETAGGSQIRQKKKRRIRRPKFESFSTPNTPRIEQEPTTPGGHARFGFIRRSTFSDIGDRGGLSEGEGRDHIAARQRINRRTNLWMTNRPDGEGDELESPRRIGQHLRRFSNLGGGVSDGDATPRRPFFGTDRAATFGAQKWRQVKSTLRLLRQRKDDQYDYFKSAELMAELTAVTPAVLMFASMIQRDEHGNKRIPVLLEQLRLRIKDSAPVPGKDSERHVLFTIELEYGSGPSQMKWTVKRHIKEIMNLHFKYRINPPKDKLTLHRPEGGRPKQPNFPISAFPYLRAVRGLDNDEEQEAQQEPLEPPPILEDPAGEATAGETAAEVTDAEDHGRPQVRKKKSRMGALGGRRKNSAMGSKGDLNQMMQDAAKKKRYIEQQQRILEKYLQEMVRWLMFRADSNRLCRFLELSALGVRLAAEGSYHGKECYLHIQSSKGLDFRRVLTPGKVIARHSKKWFLVRQSYIVCVESPENMNIYDVYLVDPKFQIVKKDKGKYLTANGNEGDEDLENFDPTKTTKKSKSSNHHTLKIMTSERKIKLFSPSQHLIQQFEESILEMLKTTPWHQRNRFGSYAPVRQGVFAQWLVDGRDYMWNVSRAISMAKDVIYIHDWWLSPELYMRRPACISQKWRLDRLLQRKAQEGVKIFVIVYRNVEAAVPIDSEYTKFSLLNLHPNIFVQRSPNQFKKNQFFFAHHEKLVIVDHDIAFVGGIDLCFGRWDTPQHPVTDDKPTGFEPDSYNLPKDAEHCQMFPGKDYSNPRVQDFVRLHEPYEEMYDRSKVPRMPWHDIAMQVVGQPARDLTRHFVQRWNYVRRGRKPTRPTPFLLPPPDCSAEELEAAGLNGTCEVQMLRSASTWSIGIDETEHSIQSAYVKMIEESDHFVYMENQFFVTSTETLNVKIVNRIGDALVERAIRAHEKGEEWRAVIIIPLMPGFQNEVNDQDGTSVRLILQCQYRSICRGEHSIFGRLKAAGINPEDYIQFFSLRQWGKLKNNSLTTEQLYIHAKCIIVDDRIALIGSANINERSMLGNRDSECAAVVRDTDMIWSTMGGKPYQVGRFAHTLRLRLMREHLGLDVDEIQEEERQAELDEAEARAEMELRAEHEHNHHMEHPNLDHHDFNDDSEDSMAPESSSRRRRSSHMSSAIPPSTPPPPQLPRHRAHSFNHDVEMQELSRPDSKGKSLSGREGHGHKHGHAGERHRMEVEGHGPDHWQQAQAQGIDEGRDSVVVNGREVLVHDIAAEGKGTLDSPHEPHELRTRPHDVASPSESIGNEYMPPMPPFNRRTTEQLGLPRANQLPHLPVIDDTDIGGPPVQIAANGTLTHSQMAMNIELANIDKDCMRDPLNPSFYDEVWSRVAENNTKIYRRVFHVMPDSAVTNWAEYKEFKASEREFKKQFEGGKTSEEVNEKNGVAAEHAQTSAGAGIGAPGPAQLTKSLTEKLVSPASKLHGGGDKGARERTGSTNTLDEKAGTKDNARKAQTFPLDAEKAAMLAASQSNGERPPTATPRDRSDSHDATGDFLNPTTTKERHATFTNNNQENPPPTSASGHSTTTTMADATPNTNSSAAAASENTATASTTGGGIKPAASTRQQRRRANTGRSRRGYSPFDAQTLNPAEAEETLRLTQGTLVQFPYDWLVTEENNGNWLFQVDQVAPLQIYN
ncbi:hypothetical protein B0T20DRAFT_389980 [Sordaria brevicollis]|uniref:Phospholipase D1 n=1 Tax=Sordaria brevicollis TaxID=83679 RepID=A0AAE0PLG9_SORBR|nr:hypothetical protein B0T20DRAFT_389980 [Sordaria brevicollis]